MARQGKARQGKARQGKARQGKARQGKARQGKARQGKARQGSKAFTPSATAGKGADQNQNPLCLNVAMKCQSDADGEPYLQHTLHHCLT